MTLAGNPYHESHPTAIIDRTNEARAEAGNETNSDPPADPTLTNLPLAPVASNRRHPSRSSLPTPVPDPFPTTGFTAIRPRPEGLSGLPSDLAPLAAPAPEAIASHFSQPSASFSLTPRLNSRKRPASLMMDLDKPGRPSQIAPDREIQMNRPNHRIPRQPVHPLRHDDELSTAQRLCDVTLDSPSSPGGGYKRMRSSADSDAGSSSCKDMDDPEIMAPDSVPALVMQLRQLLDYIASKPSLQHGSASFVRDYLRTMVLSNSYAAEKAIQESNKEHKLEVYAGRRKPSECFKFIPDELAKHIFGFLEGKHLARAREVCHRWNDFACEEPLWKSLCLKKWKALESDKDLWKLVDKDVDPEGPNCWRKIFPKVSNTSQWRCRLQKTGRFICNLVAHQISGTPLLGGLPEVLVVERRFNILHLQTFVRPDASILYFEPELASDRTGFDDFIDYLNKRTRAGLALEGQLRFIFIPPCDYTRTQVEYPGQSLLGVVQHAYPLVPEL